MARLSRERQIQNLERTWNGGLEIRSLAKLEKECQPAHGNHLGRFPEGFRSFECLPYLGDAIESKFTKSLSYKKSGGRRK